MSEDIRDDALVDIVENQAEYGSEAVGKNLFRFAHEVVRDIESPLERIAAYRELAVVEGEDSVAWESAVAEIEGLEGENADWFEAESYRDLAAAHGPDSKYWKTALESAGEHPRASLRVILLARVAMKQGPNSAGLDLAQGVMDQIEDAQELTTAAASYINECKNFAKSEGLESPYWEHAARGVLYLPNPKDRAEHARELAAEYQALPKPDPQA